jgi:hypothetical protein
MTLSISKDICGITDRTINEKCVGFDAKGDCGGLNETLSRALPHRTEEITKILSEKSVSGHRFEQECQPFHIIGLQLWLSKSIIYEMMTLSQIMNSLQPNLM